MNDLNYSFKESKNKPPSVFSEMMEQKINEENIENNLVFCIDPRKAFAIKSIPRCFSKSVTSEQNTSICYFC